MNPFLRFMKKLSLLFGRGRFLSEPEEEMAFHRGRRAIDHRGGKSFDLGDDVGQAGSQVSCGGKAAPPRRQV